MARLVVAVSAALILAACGGGVGGVAIGEGQGETVDDDSAYRCGSVELTAAELAAAPPATDLGRDGQAALEGMEVPPIDPAAGWVVLSETAEEVELLRELDAPQDGGPGDVRTFEHLRIQTLTGATNVPDGSWVLSAAGTCTPRLSLDGLGAADLVLAQPPTPDTTTVELEVHERACASGQPAEGRVEIVEQTLTDDQLRLVIGVRPRPGGQDCPGNPPTPVTVELDEPLGDRTVVDATTLPPRPVTVAPDATGGAKQEAAIARALAYQPPASYVMDVEVVCFCPGGWYRVTVVDGVKTEVLVDPNGDRPAGGPAGAPDLAPTIAEIQDELRRTVTEGGLVREIAVADDGRPSVVDLDPIVNAVDDEIRYVITELEPAGEDR